MTGHFVRAKKRIAAFAAAVLIAASLGVIAYAGGVVYQYDASGRLKSVKYPDNSTQDYKLDPAGNRTQVTAVAPTGGILALSVSSYSVGEGAGTVQLSVTRTGQTIGAVSVSYATAPGSAVAVNDYIHTSGTLNWAAGDASAKNITVTIVNDTTLESTEQFVVNLSAPTGGAVLGSPTQATVTITDNDSPSFAIANATASESAGTMSFTVTLSPATSQSYQVSYATANGTAFAGSDFTSTSGTLTFAANQTSQSISVPISPDGTYEGSEAFTITLSAPTNGAQIGTATATGTITDSNVPPSFAISDASANENAATMTFTVTKTGNTAISHSVNYATANVSATAGQDYTTTSGTLTFASTDTSKTFTVPLLDDTTYEGNETFNVNLSGATGGATIADSLGVGTILENDAAPPTGTLQFTTSTTSVTEANTNITLVVSRINGSAGTASVTCGTSNGSATAGTDYTTTSTVLTWAAGDTASKNCVIPILDDTTYEGSETFTGTLTGVSGAALGTTTSNTITITDNDAPPVFSVSTTPTVTEGGIATFTVTKSGTTSLSHNVSYSTSSGAATPPNDYTTASGVLTFAATDVTKTFTVTTAQDFVYESSEQFSGVIAVPTNGATLGTASASITIVDDDTAPTFEFVQTAQSVNENGSVTSVQIFMNGMSSFTHTVNVTTSNGTASAGTDYTDIGTVQLSFPPSGSAGQTQSVTIQLPNDGIYEGNEYFNVNLSSPTNGATIRYPSSPAMVTITDDDADVAPSAPGSLTATRVSATQVNLSWTGSSDPDVTGVSYYRVYRDGSLISSPAGTSYSDTSAPNISAYTVYAVDSAGLVSAVSNTAITLDNIAPSTPTGLNASPITPDEIYLTWDAASDTGGSGVSYYRVYRDGSYLTNTSLTAMYDTGLAPSTFHSYTVQAVDGAGNLSGQSSAAGASTLAAAPAVPTLGLNSFSGNNYILGWNPSANATYYVLEDDIGNLKYQGPNTSATVVLPMCASQAFDVRACNANSCSNPSNSVSLFHDGPGCDASRTGGPSTK